MSRRSLRNRSLFSTAGAFPAAASLPSDDDHAFVGSLMSQVIEPGKFANWIAPPARGVNNLPIEFEYVRFD